MSKLLREAMFLQSQYFMLMPKAKYRRISKPSMNIISKEKQTK